jgi:transcriptional regulator with XRE-family HTH domain
VIRSSRRSLGLSQEGFADKVGLHRTYVGAVERGERNVSLANLERIAIALGTPLSTLLRDAEFEQEGSTE